MNEEIKKDAFVPTIAYDSSVIQKIADKFYARAKNMALIYKILGATLGVLTGYGIGLMLADALDIPMAAPIVIVLVLGYAIGHITGERSALLLRYQAQLALCQMKIEENTRA